MNLKSKWKVHLKFIEKNVFKPIFLVRQMNEIDM
jgi:hypothetical protein